MILRHALHPSVFAVLALGITAIQAIGVLLLEPREGRLVSIWFFRLTAWILSAGALINAPRWGNLPRVERILLVSSGLLAFAVFLVRMQMRAMY